MNNGTEVIRNIPYRYENLQEIEKALGLNIANELSRQCLETSLFLAREKSGYEKVLFLSTSGIKFLIEEGCSDDEVKNFLEEQFEKNKDLIYNYFEKISSEETSEEDVWDASLEYKSDGGTFKEVLIPKYKYNKYPYILNFSDRILEKIIHFGLYNLEFTCSGLSFNKYNIRRGLGVNKSKEVLVRFIADSVNSEMNSIINNLVEEKWPENFVLKVI